MLRGRPPPGMVFRFGRSKRWLVRQRSIFYSPNMLAHFAGCLDC